MELKQTGAKGLIYRMILLIVPYGIETRILTSNQALLSSFNRTLWN